MQIRQFGNFDGQSIFEVTIGTPEGTHARVITWGAAVRDLVLLGAAGPERVVLGLGTLEDYVRYSPHLGATPGRFANRIRGGQFVLDGVAYQVPKNENNTTSIHGGGQGFGKRAWELSDYDASSVRMTLYSPDGDAGYPGTTEVTCLYRVIGTTLRVELSAVTDHATPINLCHHSYFNLDGRPSILDHELEIAADFYTPVDDLNLPTGEIRCVAGGPFDFRAPRPIRFVQDSARRIYDHNWVLRRDCLEVVGSGVPLAFAARLRSPLNGRTLEVWTTEPGLQVYDGHKLDLPVLGHGGVRYGPCSGICLEAQRFPDSPNQPHFPNTILRPGELSRQITEYRF
jgi:aldose 1-epimerase